LFLPTVISSVKWLLLQKRQTDDVTVLYMYCTSDTDRHSRMLQQYNECFSVQTNNGMFNRNLLQVHHSLTQTLSRDYHIINECRCGITSIYYKTWQL